MPVKRSRPLQRRLPDLILDIGKDLTGIGLVPAAVQVLGREARWTTRLPERSCGSTSLRFSKASGVGTVTIRRIENGVAQ